MMMVVDNTCVPEFVEEEREGEAQQNSGMISFKGRGSWQRSGAVLFH